MTFERRAARASCAIGDELAHALSPIGTTPEALRTLLGSFLDAGPAYLVGSLAAGYGNARSDIDVHIFETGAAAPGAPMMFFLDQTIVDVVHFRPENVDESCARLAVDAVDLGAGRCALGRSPTRREQARLGRWATAVPISEHAVEILPPERRADVAAAIVRGGLAEHLLLHTLAELATRAGLDTRGGLWRAAARSMLEVACRTHGELFVGRKWVWAKAQSVGFANEVLERVDRARTRDDLRRAADGLSVRLVEDPLGATTLVPAEGDAIRLAGRQLVLVGRRWLHDVDDLLDGSVASVAASVGDEVVLRALGAGATRAVIDDPALDAALAA